jgi:putative aldouronate transport system substrate-binding protein
MKKTISYLLVMGMAVLSLAGCGKKIDSGSNVQSTQETTNDSSSSVTIKAVIKDLSADDEVSVKFLEAVSSGVSKELGREVHIELAPISDGTYSESMGLLLQSGEIPDLMYFQGGDYQFAITQGILEDLNPYVNNSTNIKALIQPFNNQRLANYPYLLWLSPDRIKVPVVRQDWFDAAKSSKALLDNPSADNYKAFFKELKENNNLKAAFTVPGDISELDTVFNLAFGVKSTWIKEGDKYVYAKVSNAEKEKLAFYAELYKEGLLDNEWLTKKWDTKESAFYNGEVGVVSGTQGSVINIYNNKMVTQNGENAKLVILPPAKGAAQGYTPGDVSKESRGWAISKYSDHKDVAFAVLEYMAGKEGQLLDKLGYEGEEYKIENNEIVLTDKISEWWPRFHESIANFDAPISSKTPYFSEAALKSLEMVNTYSSFDNAFVIPDEYVTNWDACQALYIEFAADVISGNRSIDEFDQFVTDWNALGGAEITEYANTILK